jgi:hypothetical protein
MPARARALPATRLAKIARACPNSAPENPRRSGAVPEAETFVTELQCAKESKRVESERYLVARAKSSDACAHVRRDEC